MGVERQAAKINWITSLAMIVAGGTLFRLRNVARQLSKLHVRELRERAGQIYAGKPRQPCIVPPPPSTVPGKWEKTLAYRQQYRWLARLYTASEGSFRRPD
jgi:hypothetical protein